MHPAMAALDSWTLWCSFEIICKCIGVCAGFRLAASANRCVAQSCACIGALPKRRRNAWQVGHITGLPAHVPHLTGKSVNKAWGHAAMARPHAVSLPTILYRRSHFGRRASVGSFAICAAAGVWGGSPQAPQGFSPRLQFLLQLGDALQRLAGSLQRVKRRKPEIPFAAGAKASARRAHHMRLVQ